MKIALSPELEHSLAGAVLRGLVPAEVVKDEELSKTGRVVFAAMRRLRDEGAAAGPLDRRAVTSCAVEVLGGGRTDVKEFLRKVHHTTSGTEVGWLVQAVRDKQVLADLISTAAEQLANGKLDVGAITDRLSRREGATVGVERRAPVSKLLGKGRLKPRLGPRLPGLNRIMQATGGLFGMWVVGGDAGVGKSTLALQFAVEYARLDRPVLYLDYENGEDVQAYRIQEGFPVGGAKAAENIYVFESIEAMERDRSAYYPADPKAPPLLIVDSLQSLPTDAKHPRTSLDRWLKHFEGLVRQGYIVLALSEKARSTYGEAKLTGFKESGEIEYKAWVGAQMFEDEDKSGLIHFHLVKNRHRPRKGWVTCLEREDDWRFTEAERPESGR